MYFVDLYIFMANLALCIIDLFIFLILIVNEISVIVIREFCLHLLYSLKIYKYIYIYIYIYLIQDRNFTLS